MENINSFEQLLDYPIVNRLIYATHLNDQRFYLSPEDSILHTKYIIFENQNLIFCAYDSFANQLSTTQTFTGIYCPIGLKPEMELTMTRKYWVDYLFTLNKRKKGIERLDNNFTMSARKNWNFKVLLGETEVQLMQELEKLISPVKLIIQHDYIPLISELRGQQVIGLETNQWISEPNEVERFLDLGGRLINNIIKTSNQYSL